MQPRAVVLATAAALIIVACWYKATRTYGPASERVMRCPARGFPKPLLNQQNQLVRLKTYLGRHRILVVFYDGNKGAEADPTLVRLRTEHARLKANGVIVLGISTAIPQQNRPPREGVPYCPPNSPQKAFPFDLLTDLTDLGPQHPVHEQWGRLDATSKQTRPGVFLIQRDQTVRCDGEKPLPVVDANAVIDGLLRN